MFAYAVKPRPCCGGCPRYVQRSSALNLTLLYLISGLTALLLTGLFVFLSYKAKNAAPVVQKSVAVLAGAAYSWAWFCARTAIELTAGFNRYSPFGQDIATTAVTLLVIWVGVVIALLAAMYPFSRLRGVRNILRFIGTPFALFQLAWVTRVGRAIVGADTASATAVGRLAACAFYVGALVALVASAWLDRDTVRMTGRETARMFGWFFGGMLIALPPYMLRATETLFRWIKPLQSIVSGSVMDLKPAHRIVLYFGILLSVLIWLALRKEEQPVRHFALVFISLATLMTFSADFTLQRYTTSSFWPIEIPLHLCNTAMYLVPLCLIFRMKRLYYFTFFINVIGAFFAMAMPNYSENTELFAVSMLVFWVNHYSACFMPVLMMALGEFERPKLKQFWYSTVAFSAYYVLVLFLNAWFSNFGTSDFFFINSDFIAEKLGTWAERLRDITASFTLGGLTFTFYPVYQLLFFAAYIAFTFGMWFLYEQCFSVTDLYTDMAKRSEKIKVDRLALLSQLDGRSEEDPLDMEHTDALILHNVTKRYGKSSVYAVKDANLEVRGGQIFGFLGPNGAGKSTIIKSIVGIQPISSGDIMICGYDAMRQPVQAKRQLGFVPDHYELYENLTGREYINYIADLYRVTREDRDTRIAEYVALFQLEGSFDNPMKTYSHGMKQKIAIMAALVHEPKVWILDEPLTGLDPDSIFQVKECMRRHAAKGNIVFFSSHIIDVVERLCDHIAIIRKGHILCRRTMAEVEATGMPLEEFYMKTIRGELPADDGDIPMDATPVGHEKAQVKA